MKYRKPTLLNTFHKEGFQFKTRYYYHNAKGETVAVVNLVEWWGKKGDGTKGPFSGPFGDEIPV